MDVVNPDFIVCVVVVGNPWLSQPVLVLVVSRPVSDEGEETEDDGPAEEYEVDVGNV